MTDRLTAAEVVELQGQTPLPPVAPAGTSRIVHDTSTGAVYLSVSGGAYQPLMSGAAGGGSGVIAFGNGTLPTGADTYRLTPWYEEAVATTLAAEWDVPDDGTVRNLFVRHNGAGVGGDITYELFVNGAASGLSVVLAASGTVASSLGTVVSVSQGDRLELRASHAGIGTSPARIFAVMQLGLARFGDDYQAVESAALFSTGAGLTAPTSFVTKPGSSLTTPPLTGTYRVAWRATYAASEANVTVGGRLFNVTDAVVVGVAQMFQPKSPSDLEDMNGTNEVVFGGAAKTFSVQINKEEGPDPSSVSVRDARIELWRVGP